MRMRVWKPAWAGAMLSVKEWQHRKSDVSFKDQVEVKRCARTVGHSGVNSYRL